MLTRFDQMEHKIKDLTEQESNKRHMLDNDLQVEQEKVLDLEQRLEEEMHKHQSFKVQL